MRLVTLVRSKFALTILIAPRVDCRLAIGGRNGCTKDVRAKALIG